MARRRGALTVSIVGAGKVGSALALLLRNRGIRVASVISRNKTSARKAASLAGCRQYSNRYSDIHPDTDFLLLAVSDDEVNTAAREIAASARVDFRRLACAHTSGILTSDELKPLARLGTMVFSLHPIQSFPGGFSRRQQLEALKGISYGVEGSPKAIRFATTFVRRIGGKMFRVPKERKILYHLACVFASNYSVSMLSVVGELTKGVSKAASLKHFEKLTESSIKNTYRTSPHGALTGPIARGDVRSVRKHFSQLEGKRKHLKNLYKMLGRYALELAKRNRQLTTKQIRQLKSALK